MILNIGIDIDDTITNSSEVFIKYARIYNKIKKINFKINTNEIDQTLAFGWSENNKKEFKKLFLRKILSEAIPNPNAFSAIKALKRKGHTIILISARTDGEIPNMFDFTKEWLEKNNIVYDELVVNSKDKLLECKKRKIDIFIDDNFYTCEQVSSESSIFVMMYKTNYNKSIPTNIVKVKGWIEILSVINNTKRS